MSRASTTTVTDITKGPVAIKDTYFNLLRNESDLIRINFLFTEYFAISVELRNRVPSGKKIRDEKLTRRERRMFLSSNNPEVRALFSLREDLKRTEKKMLIHDKDAAQVISKLVAEKYAAHEASTKAVEAKPLYQ